MTKKLNAANLLITIGASMWLITLLLLDGFPIAFYADKLAEIILFFGATMWWRGANKAILHSEYRRQSLVKFLNKADRDGRPMYLVIQGVRNILDEPDNDDDRKYY